MFLFSKQPTQGAAAVPPTPQADHPLAQPLRSAADATGVSFDYLVKTAKRESNLNPDARASTSSATGLFQFIEQTWLGLVKRQGPDLGLTDQANAIQRDGSGRYVVPEAEARQQILALRKDPALSAKLAGLFTRENRASLREALGREPSGGELYIAHFLGAGGARELITMASGNPERAAASAFPDAASANRPIFFDRNGRARSAREVYSRLVSYHDGADTALPVVAQAGGVTASAQAEAGPATRSPLAIAPARNVTMTGQIRREATATGFFTSGGNTAAAGNLRKTWMTIAESRLNPNAPSFFPRGDGVKVAAIGPISAPPSETVEDLPTSPLAAFEARADEEPASPRPIGSRRYEAVEAPLPPVRPSFLGKAGQALELGRMLRKRG
ncbi:MAG: transglycosylase SLT domain-containing protein [Hyphomicrobiales bacterium]|uniref:PABP-interacting PAM2 motif-containing protein n=1 Tax=Rhabdaerophilum calidifontis TaxID=2604328 RepID=UPI00123A4DE2|nr:transglycosylase SLT domain-containing protein [Rhabdaerophilum calidifontis]MCA1999349.1 transglycosylase SLT domain-containing protein [Hyphomicrobiales bacterium]